MRKKRLFGILSVVVFIFISSCKKDVIAVDSLYIPSSSDVTANATLDELQQGHTIYLNSCGVCHGLYRPDSYSVSRWKGIMINMAPEAGLTATQTSLVIKYVCRGKQ